MCNPKKSCRQQDGRCPGRGRYDFHLGRRSRICGRGYPFQLEIDGNAPRTLLDQVPHHKGLLYALASGFTQYGYVYVQLEADDLENTDLEAAFALRDRARRLYLRARNYGLRGLEASHRNFEAELWTNPVEAVKQANKKDVPLLFWTAYAWLATIGLAKNDPDLIGDLPIVQALIDRALELDESYDSGAIHGFLITYEMLRLDHPDLPEVRARRHYARAVELNGGYQASPHISLAESVSIPNQNRVEFERLLRKAIAVNTDVHPEWRLANLIYQRRARWLLDRVDRYFLD